MKKQIWKRGMALLLALCMVVGLYNGAWSLQDVLAEETTKVWTFSDAGIADGKVTAGDYGAVKLGGANVELDGSQFNGYVTFNALNTANMWGWDASQLILGTNDTASGETTTGIHFAIEESGGATYLVCGTYNTSTAGAVKHTFMNIPIALETETFLQISFDYSVNSTDEDYYDLALKVTANGQTEGLLIEKQRAATTPAYASAFVHPAGEASGTITARSVYDLTTNITDGGTYLGAKQVTITTPASDGKLEKDLAGVTVNGSAANYTISEDGTTASLTLSPADATQTVIITNKAGVANTYQVTVKEATNWTFSDAGVSDGKMTAGSYGAVKLDGANVKLDESQFNGYVTFHALNGANAMWGWHASHLILGTNTISEGQTLTGVHFSVEQRGNATYLVCGAYTEGGNNAKKHTFENIPIGLETETFLQISFDYSANSTDGSYYDLILTVSANGNTEQVVIEKQCATTITAYASVYVNGDAGTAADTITARSVYDLTTNIADGGTYLGAKQVTITTPASDGKLEKDLAGVTVNGSAANYTISEDGTTASLTLLPADASQTVIITNKAGVTSTYQVTVKEATNWTFSDAEVSDGKMTAGSYGAVKLDEANVKLDESQFNGYVTFHALNGASTMWGWHASHLILGTNTISEGQTLTGVHFSVEQRGNATYLVCGAYTEGGNNAKKHTFENIPIALETETFLQISFDYSVNSTDSSYYDLKLTVSANGNTEQVVIEKQCATTITAYASVYVNGDAGTATDTITARSVHHLTTNITDGGTYFGEQKVIISTPATDGDVRKDIAKVTVDGKKVPYATSMDSTGKVTAAIELQPADEEQIVVLTNKIGGEVTYKATIKDLEGRTAFTFRDLQGDLKHDGTVSTAIGAETGYRPLGLTDTVFSGYVVFPAGGNLKYSTAQGTEGNDAGVYLQLWRHTTLPSRIYLSTSTGEDTWIDSVTAEDGKEFYLQIVNTMGDDGTANVTFYMDGSLVEETTIDTDKLGNGLAVKCGTSGDTVWRSAESTIELKKRTYDLTDGEAGYLITGDGSFCVDGEYVTTGTVINTVGTYQVERTLDGAAYTRTVEIVDSRTNPVQIPALTYDYLGGDEVMPIVGHYIPDQKTIYPGTNNEKTVNYTTDNIYRMTKDSGINMINWTETEYKQSTEAVEEQLRLAEKYGLGMYVYDSNIYGLSTDNDASTSAVSALNKYSSYESYLGNLLRDEPGTDTYYVDGNTPHMDNYKAVSKHLNQYNNMTGFINLLPMLDDCNRGSSELEAEYTNYVNKYANNFDGKVISFDRYPSTADISYDSNNLKDGVILTNSKDFYTNLSIIRNTAAMNHLPFWTFVETGDYNNVEDSFTKPNQITGEEILWYVNTALAYGSKGIEYYTVVEVDSTGELGDDGATKHGLIDVNGNKTKYYAPVKEANDQIQAVDHVLMKSINQGVIPTDGYVESNITGSEKITDVSAYNINSIATTGTTYGALTGVFQYYPDETQNTAYNAYYVVNSDPTAEQTITLNFNNATTYTMIQEGIGKYYGTATTSIKLEIQAGEGVLVVAGMDVTEGDAKETKEAFTVYYEDIAPYRADAVTGVVDRWAPSVTGYEFAGWFEDEACTKAIAESMLSGAAYAKYVDAKILAVKTQLKQDHTALRFVSTIDSNAYKNVGFEVRYNDTNKINVSTDAYMYLFALNSTTGETDTLLPTLFSSKSLAFFAYQIQGIPSNAKNVPFITSSYWETLDGTKVYGDTVSYSINDAIRLDAEAN